MKFWEWWIFTTGILCVLSADSSIGWCAVLAIACLFGIIMRQFLEEVASDTRRSRMLRKALEKGEWTSVDANRACGDILMQKSTTPMAVESDAWVGHCETNYPTSDSITIWEEYQ